MMAKKMKLKVTKRTLTSAELKKIVPGPIQHSALDPFLTEWARKLFERAGYLVQPAFELWELNFMRDIDPVREIFIWESIARALEAHLINHPNCDKEKACRIFSTISMGARFQPETDETEEMRKLWLSIWAEMNEDPNTTIEQIRRSLDS